MLVGGGRIVLSGDRLDPRLSKVVPLGGGAPEVAEAPGVLCFEGRVSRWFLSLLAAAVIVAEWGRDRRYGKSTALGRV